MLLKGQMARESPGREVHDLPGSTPPASPVSAVGTRGSGEVQETLVQGGGSRPWPGTGGPRHGAGVPGFGALGLIACGGRDYFHWTPTGSEMGRFTALGTLTFSETL